MAQVTFKNVYKRFDVEDVISDFSLEIEDGEFMVFVGPSGCGKSTTLRMVAGLESVTSGEIFIGDGMVNDLQPKDRDIAMVFQNYALYPHMDVFSNMAFGLKLRKTPTSEIEKRVEQAAEILEIHKLLKRKPRELSGGQSQRVALGRAIVRQPKVFLFDEPLSNLDAKLRVQMRTEINRLHERLKTTIIYVTHDQTEAMTMGDRITILNAGKIQQVGSPLELYKQPANKFVAGFIGSPPMNFFNVRVDKSDDNFFLVGQNFRLKITSDDVITMLKTNQEKDFCLGLRPEAFHVVESPDGSDDNILVSSVEVSENMGSEQLLYLHVGDAGTRFVARVPPDNRYAFGQSISLLPDLEAGHLFHTESEQVLA